MDFVDLLPQFLIDSILLGGLYTLMAIGFSLSFGVTRIINFAHGEFIMLGAYASFWAFTLAGLDPLVAMPLIIVSGFLAGWLLFRLFIERVLSAPHINQILLTFGIGLVIQHIAVILWSGNSRSATPDYAFTAWIFDDLFLPHGRLVGCLIAVALVLALIAWLKWTEGGRAVRAVAQNHDAATLMGINVKRMYALSFAISSALGAATGVVVSFIITVTPFMGFPMLVKAVAIVILGGLGSVAGTAAGAFLLAFFETGFAYYVPEGSGWSEGLAFVLIVAILIVRPRGLFGQSEA
jgi:branched-chain amino acid transport system permease protein